MTYTYRRTLSLVLVSLVFLMTACSDQNQVVVPRAPGEILENNKKVGASPAGARLASAQLAGPGPVINHPGRDDQKESVKPFVEDREKKRMGLLVLLLMGASEQPLSIQ